MSLNDEYYFSKWKSIAKILKKSNLKIGGIAQAGSRAKQLHSCHSDLDVIFFVAGDPSREDFYPVLIQILSKNFQEAHGHSVYPGSENNVVHIETKPGGIFDLVLLPESDFERQHGNDVEWRRKNL